MLFPQSKYPNNKTHTKTQLIHSEPLESMIEDLRDKLSNHNLPSAERPCNTMILHLLGRLLILIPDVILQISLPSLQSRPRRLLSLIQYLPFEAYESAIEAKNKLLLPNGQLLKSKSKRMNLTMPYALKF